MDKIRFTAELENLTENKGAVYAHIGVKAEQSGNDIIVAKFMPEMMLAILRGMRDTCNDAFYNAMAAFANEDMDNAQDWIDKRAHR